MAVVAASTIDKTASILEKAADTAHAGWIQGSWAVKAEDTGSSLPPPPDGVFRCAVGAILQLSPAAFGPRAILNRSLQHRRAIAAFRDFLVLHRGLGKGRVMWDTRKEEDVPATREYMLTDTDAVDEVSEWSEAYGRTKTQVVSSLRACAKMVRDHPEQLPSMAKAAPLHPGTRVRVTV